MTEPQPCGEFSDVRATTEQLPGSPVRTEHDELDAPSASRENSPSQQGVSRGALKKYQVPCDLPPSRRPYPDLWDSHLALLDRKRIRGVLREWINLFRRGSKTKEEVYVMMKFALRRPKMPDQDLIPHVATFSRHSKAERPTSPEMKVRHEDDETRPVQTLQHSSVSIESPRSGTIPPPKRSGIAKHVSTQKKSPTIRNTANSASRQMNNHLQAITLLIETARRKKHTYQALERLQQVVYAIRDFIFERQISSILNPKVEVSKIALSLYEQHIQLVDELVVDESTLEQGEISTKVQYSDISYDEAFKLGSEVPTGALLDYVIEDLEIIRYGDPSARRSEAIAKIRLIHGCLNDELLQSSLGSSTLPFSELILDRKIDPARIVAQMWNQTRGFPFYETYKLVTDYTFKGGIANLVRDLVTGDKGVTCEEATRRIKVTMKGLINLDLARCISDAVRDGFVPYHRIARRICRETTLDRSLKSPPESKAGSRPETNVESSRKPEMLKKSSLGRNPKMTVNFRSDRKSQIKELHEKYVHGRIDQPQVLRNFRKVMGNGPSAEEQLILIMVALDISWELYFQPSSEIMQRYGHHFRGTVDGQQLTMPEASICKTPPIAEVVTNAFGRPMVSLSRIPEDDQASGPNVEISSGDGSSEQRPSVTPKLAEEVPCTESSLPFSDNEDTIMPLAPAAESIVPADTPVAEPSTQYPSPDSSPPICTPVMSRARSAPLGGRASETTNQLTRKRKRPQVIMTPVAAAAMELDQERADIDALMQSYLHFAKHADIVKRKLNDPRDSTSTTSPSLSALPEFDLDAVLDFDDFDFGSESESTSDSGLDSGLDSGPASDDNAKNAPDSESDPDPDPDTDIFSSSPGRKRRPFAPTRDCGFDANSRSCSYFQKSGITKPTTATLNKLFDEYRGMWPIFSDYWGELQVTDIFYVLSLRQTTQKTMT